ncbi:MAG: hypothetical protein IT423_07945 [Pirellulaceae bacterium]|nr:hypothetical protein [Pirellulaceae bacterium]
MLIYPTYEAESFVRVRQHQDVVFAPQSSRADDLAFVRAQEQLALSPQVVSSALGGVQLESWQQFIPHRAPSDWLKSLVRVDMQSGSEVLSIAAKHPVPQVAQAISNAMTDAYMAEITERLVSDQGRRITELERAAQDAEQHVDGLWAELNEVAIKIGSENSQSLTIRDEIQLQAYRDYAQQLRAAQIRGHELASQLEEARNLANAQAVQSREQDIEAGIQAAPEVISAQDRVAVLEDQLRQMREIVAHEDSPRLKRLSADRDFYASELVTVIQLVGPRVQAQVLEQTRGAAQTSLTQLQKQIELNESEKEFLRNRLADIDTSTLRGGEQTGLQLDVKRHAVDRQARLADGLWQSLEELKIERQSQPRVQLMQLANLPDSASHAKQLKAVGAVVAVCWIIIVLGTGYVEWRSCTIRHTADIVENSCFPVFGDVEPSANRFARRPQLRHMSGAQEAVSQMLLSTKQGVGIPSLIVTSATQHEPRHKLARDVASAFAALHHKTLLVDLDPTDNRLARELGCADSPGLLEICNRKLATKTFIRKSQQGVDVLPLGATHGNSVRIDPARFAEVLKELQHDYEAIVAVGPSLLDYAEGLIHAAQLDQLLLTVGGGKSHWNELAKAEQAALRAGLCCVGTAVNCEQRGQTIQLTAYDVDSQQRQHISNDESSESDIRNDLSAIENEIRQAMTEQSQLPQVDAI